MSCSVWLSAWPMCSSPVMLGGGRQMVYFGFLLDASATNSPSLSQRAYQPASTAVGSNAVGIVISVLLIRACSDQGFGNRCAGEDRLTRACRLAYSYRYEAAHGAKYVSACAFVASPALRSVSSRRWSARR